MKTLKQDKRWTEKAIEERKARIKRELDEVESQNGLNAKTEWLNLRIKALEGTSDSDGLLSLYIYLLSSLVHHTRIQHLSENQIKKTLQLANSILVSRGIREGVSRLSFLHGELQFITSQIERQRGRHFSAAWYQYLGEQVSRGEAPGGKAFKTLSMANRALRLGFTELALEGLKEAEDLLKEPHLIEMCLTNQLKALRLSGRHDEASSLLEKVRTRRSISPSLELELDWEENLVLIRKDGDFSRLISLTRRNKSHYHVSYIVEASLWLMASAQRSWIERLPILENLKRRKDLQWKRDDPFYETAKCIQECYDFGIPISTRLRKLGQHLSGINQMPTIDKELLCLAAASRFLLRSRSESLARLSLNLYRSHSLTLSSGSENDALGLFQDIK